MQINVYTSTPTPTEARLFEMMTENTGTHFLDSGMSDGRHWQQNQKLTVADFMARPKATLETEYGTYPTLDLFHFLNDRLTLTERAKQLQADFEQYVNETSDLTFYDLEAMETFVHYATEATEQPSVSNSYNWENYLSQTIQYVDFQVRGESFTLLQIHGGADVRGGYTRPQVFETTGELWSYSMQNASVQCTNEECDWSVEIYGCTDIIGQYGSAVMTSSEFSELKKCPECGGELQALAPEANSY